MFQNAVATEFNCGFGRAAIRELTPVKRGCQGRCIDHSKRQQEFRQLFERPSYNLPSGFFDNTAAKTSIFEKRCDQVLNAFSRKWGKSADRATYLAVFGVQQWKSLTENQKAKHTLSNCKECYRAYYNTQQLFPVKPMFIPEECTVKLPENPRVSERSTARRILKDANAVWQQTYGHTFTSVVPQLCPEANLQMKKSKIEAKKEKRHRERKIVKHVHHQMEKKATLTMLASGESHARYHKKRLSMSFETNQLGPSHAKKQKRHSPADENCSWDTNAVLNDLNQWPEGVRINWSDFARKHNVPGRNAGQVVKEFAKRHNINTFSLDQRPDTPRTRPRRYKLPGREISSPSLPPLNAVLKERDQMIADGRLKIGEPCTPYTMTRFKTSTGGRLFEKAITISGRKFSLLEIRAEMLVQHQQYMHLYSDDQIQAMTTDEIKRFLHCHSIHADNKHMLSDLQNLLARTQRTRTLVLWHDHATILGTGYILVTVGTIYDQGVHLNEEEYYRRTGKEVKNIQKLVEAPHIHIIGVGSSSVEDQASVLPDRVECLNDLHKVSTTSLGIPINDELRFFKGDTPAQQFERGTQQGGHYKCGGCGCHAQMMEDMAHALECKWRSLTELQELVLAGKHGNQPGALKPFEALNVQQLHEELRARNVYHEATTKSDLTSTLRGILCGAQRVPSLLLANPTLPLEALHLQHYTILDSEPLHDLKGHLFNLFSELPYILNGDVKETCQKIIKSNLSKEKVKCADLRLTAVHLYQLFLQHYRDDDYQLLLIQTAVQISEILYLPAYKRSPKRVLQLYNCTWLHHTLCSLMFPTLKCLTREKMFGTYLHHLSSHAPTQYEIIALSSVNTEAEERLFGQAKQMATQASNRHHENALFNVLIRLQAKQLLDETTTVVQKQEGRVSQIASHLPKYPGTRLSKTFIQHHLSSWQAHLKRISTFLLMGKGVWWKTDNDYYVFSDSSEDPEYLAEGPPLLHFRNTQLQDVSTQSKACWETLIANKIELPTPQVRLYDDNGMPSGTINFESVQPATNTLCSHTTTPSSSIALGSSVSTPLCPPDTTPLCPSHTTPLCPPDTTPLCPPDTTPLCPSHTTPLCPSHTTPLCPPDTTPLCPSHNTALCPPDTTPLSSQPITPLCPPVTTTLGSQATAPVGSYPTNPLCPPTISALDSSESTPLHSPATTALDSQCTPPLGFSESVSLCYPPVTTSLGSSESTPLCPPATTILGSAPVGSHHITPLGSYPTTPSATRALGSQTTTSLGYSESTPLHPSTTAPLNPTSGNRLTTRVTTQEPCTSNLTSLLACHPTDPSTSTPQNHRTHSPPIRHLFENEDSILSENDDDERQLEEATLHGLLKHTEDATINPLKTKMAIAISKAVGIDDTVKRFDEIRVKLKSQKLKGVRLTREQVQEHHQLMATIQLNVIRKKSELKESIKSHELKFQREHSRLPGQHEDESFAKLYKKLKYVKWLLTSWDIRL